MPRSHGRTGRPWRRLAAQVLANSTHCAWCGGLLWPGAPRNHRLESTVDHLVALTDGGAERDPANLVAMHRGCNSAKENARRRADRHGTSRIW